MTRLLDMRPLVVILAALLLTGCAAGSSTESASPPSSSPSPSPSPSPSVDPNVGACEDFLDTFNTITEASTARNEGTMSIEEWTEILDRAATDYSEASLEAEGDVKSRIDGLIELIDAEPSGMRGLNFTSDNFDRYFSQLERIGQACTEAGVDIDFTQS